MDNITHPPADLNGFNARQDSKISSKAVIEYVFTRKVINNVEPQQCKDIHARNTDRAHIAVALNEPANTVGDKRMEKIKEDNDKKIENTGTNVKSYNRGVWKKELSAMRPFYKRASPEVEFEEPIRPTRPGVIQEVDIRQPAYPISLSTIAMEGPEPPDRQQSQEEGQQRELWQSLQGDHKQAQELEKGEEGLHAGAAAVAKYDDLDLLFLSYAKTVKAMKKRRQAKLKYKLAKAIMDAEIAEIENSELDEDFTSYECEYHRYLTH